MKLIEFCKDVYNKSHIQETRVYYKRFLKDKTQIAILLELRRVVKKYGLNYFVDSKSNMETKLAYNIDKDSIKNFILNKLESKDILAGIFNISNTFKTDDDELFLCSGYADLSELATISPTYVGQPITDHNFHYYFKFGFTDNHKGVIVASFHRVNDSHSKNQFRMNGRTDFYFDDSHLSRPRYFLLKSYMNGWVECRLRHHSNVFMKNFKSIDLDHDIKFNNPDKPNLVLRGKPNTHLTDEEFEELKKDIIKLKYSNLYTFRGNNSIKLLKNTISNANDVAIELEKSGEEI